MTLNFDNIRQQYEDDFNKETEMTYDRFTKLISSKTLFGKHKFPLEIQAIDSGNMSISPFSPYKVLIEVVDEMRRRVKFFGIPVEWEDYVEYLCVDGYMTCSFNRAILHSVAIGDTYKSHKITTELVLDKKKWIEGE